MPRALKISATAPALVATAWILVHFMRLGAAQQMLPRGPHMYRISYRTARQLGFFERHDELYWNVTGNGWSFWSRQMFGVPW